MERYAWRARVLPGMLSEYIRRHDEIWPEMTALLNEAGIRNYTIWNVGDELFGYYECEDLARADAFKAQSPVQRRWSEYMADLISREEIDGAPVPAPELVFYLP